MRKSIFFFLLILLIAACNQNIDKEYQSEIEKWRQDRFEYLKKPDSWFSLAGLFWLKEGENSFGTAAENDIIFPKGKAYMGRFIYNDSTVTFVNNNEKSVLVNDSSLSTYELKSDLTKNVTLLKYNSLTFFLIERDGKMGIRLKDSENPALKSFTGLRYFPISEEWKIPANFTPYSPEKPIVIPTVLGTESIEKSPGYFTFTVDGKTLKLDVLSSGNGFFIVFADQTSGEETYGAGRFLTVNAADSSGNYFIDFNTAYNPPCAFTKYATCPLPPKDNYLQIAVNAGEKSYH